MKIGTIAAATAIALLAASFGATGSAAEETKQVFSAAYTTSFPDLDPSTSSSNENAILANVYEPLVWYRVNENGEGYLEPALATAWGASNDGLEWTFSLRQGVSFHDGTPFNSAAVKYSLERTMEIGGGLSWIWYSVESVEAPDDFTVVIRTSAPAPLDLIASSTYAAWIMSPAVADKGADWFNACNVAGTGPYVIRQHQPGERTVLEPFDGYWGGWADEHVDIAVFEVVEDTVLREQMLLSGQVDWTAELEVDNLERIDAAPGVRVDRAPSYINNAGHFNTSLAPLDDVRVRQALSYAFPYDDYVALPMSGTATQAFGPVPATMSGKAENGVRYAHDLDRARALLAEAGYPDGGFEVTATYTSGISAGAKATELYKAELAKIGVTLNIQPMSWEAQWELAKSGAENAQGLFLMYWWPTYITPYDFLASLYRTEDEPFFNLAYYSNPEFDALIDGANVQLVTDRESALREFSQASDLLTEDAVSLFLFDQESIHGVREGIEGYVDNPAYSHVVFLRDLRL